MVPNDEALWHLRP